MTGAFLSTPARSSPGEHLRGATLLHMQRMYVGSDLMCGLDTAVSAEPVCKACPDSEPEIAVIKD